MREIADLLARPLLETILMVFASTSIASLLGGSLGLSLYFMSNERLSEHARQLSIVKKIADRAINTLRSFPFIILMVLVLPLSRLLVGTSLGTIAAIVPLSVAASPFVARIVVTKKLSLVRIARLSPPQIPPFIAPSISAVASIPSIAPDSAWISSPASRTTRRAE